MGKRRIPRQERARITRDAIVEAAERILAEEGYAAASTNAIARRAGVSIGSLYQYFRDKDEVFGEVLERHHAEARPIKESALGELSAGDDVAAVLRRAMDRSLAMRDRNPALMNAIDGELTAVVAQRTGADPGDETDGSHALAAILAQRELGGGSQLGEKAWLTIAVLESVGRRLVHGALPDLERNTVIDLTVGMLTDLLTEAPAAGPGAPSRS